MNANTLLKSVLVASVTWFVGVGSPIAAGHGNNYANAENVAPSTVRASASGAPSTPLITSKAQLQTYLVNHAKSPLDALTAAAKQRFLDSLVFTEKGLATFQSADLESELTPTQIYAVLQLFGLGRDTALFQNARVETDRDRTLLRVGGGGTDHPHMYCNGTHTCVPSGDNRVCTSNC